MRRNAISRIGRCNVAEIANGERQGFSPRESIAYFLGKLISRSRDMLILFSLTRATLSFSLPLSNK